jgi:hypothetical protein
VATSKALKGLWKFDMTTALLPEAPIKLIKALKKTHSAVKVQQQAGAVFNKWAMIVKTASAVVPVPAPPKAYDMNKCDEKKRPRPEDTAAKPKPKIPKIRVEAALPLLLFRPDLNTRMNRLAVRSAFASRKCSCVF